MSASGVIALIIHVKNAARWPIGNCALWDNRLMAASSGTFAPHLFHLKRLC